MNNNSSAPSVVSRLRVCVILTCFNRKEKTLACFRALSANMNPARLDLAAVLVDDGSTDGTGEALQGEFPWVQLVSGSGNLYWCRGMHTAFEVAARNDYDYYLWLNDDTILAPNALERLLASESALRERVGKPVIVVGSTVDAATGQLTYGGVRRAARFKPVTFLRINPTSRPQRCDSMTGNIVLVPREIAMAVGNLNPIYEHAMGDIDYALRARRMGFEVWLGAGVFGTCSDNPTAGTFRDAGLSLRRRWQLMMDRKGLPWRSWLAFTRLHTGPLWPVYFAWPYLSLLAGKYDRK